MSVLFVADPIERLDPAIDTTLGLIHATQDAGEQAWLTEAKLLEIVETRPRALARPIRLAASEPADGCRWTVPQPWFELGPAVPVWLDRFAAVFMRTDPPLDQTYLHATLVLDLLDPERVSLVNDPRGLRCCSEHLLPLQFPHLTPPTVVSADRRTIRAFLDDHGPAVLKPVDGFSGRGVLRLNADDDNLGSLLEIATDDGSRAVVVQRYLSEVTGGNKRLFLLDGEPRAAVLRYPASGDFRIGQPSAVAPITDRDRHICRRLAPVLARNGLRVVGLDVIGDHLIEVNITSPGALRKADALLGTRLCAEVIERVLGTTVTSDSATPILRRSA